MHEQLFNCFCLNVLFQTLSGMKKGIPIALLAAGMIAACQVTPLNHPVRVLEAVAPSHDTIFFYSENGKLLLCKTDVDSLGSYVIRTCRTSADIYRDWINRNESSSSSKFDTANVRPISPQLARIVARRIKKGIIDSLVLANIVPILDKQWIRKMHDALWDSGRGRRKNRDYCEYGGVMKTDSSFTFQVGEHTNPCSTIDAAIKIKDTGAIRAKVYYHSHPSGEDEIFYPMSRKTEECSFVQGPSRNDQKEVGKKKGYVFAMRKGYHCIYIYDSTGILATLPFKYWNSKCNNKSLSVSYKNIKK